VSFYAGGRAARGCGGVFARPGVRDVESSAEGGGCRIMRFDTGEGVFIALQENHRVVLDQIGGCGAAFGDLVGADHREMHAPTLARAVEGMGRRVSCVLLQRRQCRS